MSIQAPSLMEYIRDVFLPFTTRVDNGLVNTNELEIKLQFMKHLFYESIANLKADEYIKAKFAIDSYINELYYIATMVIAKVFSFSFYNYVADNVKNVA